MADFNVTALDAGIDFDALEYWDVVIIGAGPAGLAAGLTTAHRGLTTLVVEAKDRPGGQPQFLYPDKKIVDIPGFPDGISGEELSARVYRQANDALVQFRFGEELVDIEDTGETAKGEPLKRVVTRQSGYLCRKVIIACGLLHFPRRLPVLDALESRSVHYRVPRVGDYEGQEVAVVGAGDSALDAAVMVQGRRGGVHLIVRGVEPAGKAETFRRVQASGAGIHMPSEIVAAVLEGDRIRLSLSTGESLVIDQVIVQIGFLSAKDTFRQLDVRLNENGSIAIDPYYETSRKGIFAIGDVHGDIKLIVVAWAEGIQAAIYAFKEITSPYWLSEKRLHDQKITMIGEKISEAVRTRPK